MRELEERLRHDLTDLALPWSPADPQPALRARVRRRRVTHVAGAVVAVAATVTTVFAVGGSSLGAWRSGPAQRDATVPTTAAAPTSVVSSASTVRPEPAPSAPRYRVAVVSPPVTQEDALRNWLETDAAARDSGIVWSNDGYPVYCGLDVLGSSSDARYVYAVGACTEFAYRDGQAEVVSGFGALPMRFTVTGAGAGTRVVDVEEAPPGAATTGWIRDTFPAAIVEKAAAVGSRASDGWPEMQQRAIADAERAHAG